jgi:hypothetical protein
VLLFCKAALDPHVELPDDVHKALGTSDTSPSGSPVDTSSSCEDSNDQKVKVCGMYEEVSVILSIITLRAHACTQWGYVIGRGVGIIMQKLSLIS